MDGFRGFLLPTLLETLGAKDAMLLAYSHPLLLCTYSLDIDMLDIERIREDFPILRREVYDRPLVYFDNAATTQKPRCVVEKIEAAYYNVNANIHRGVHCKACGCE